MKRIFAFVICAVLLLCAFPVVAIAEGEAPEIVVQEPTLTDEIVGYIKGHIEEISVIITLILTAFYNKIKHKTLNKSIGTVNNNAVTVAENSQSAISQALAKMEDVTSALTGYQVEFEKMLTEFRANAAETKACGRDPTLKTSFRWH